MWGPFAPPGPTSPCLCETLFPEHQRTRESTQKDLVLSKLLLCAPVAFCSETALEKEMLWVRVAVLYHHPYSGQDGIPEWVKGLPRGLKSSKKELANEAPLTSLRTGR